MFIDNVVRVADQQLVYYNDTVKTFYIKHLALLLWSCKPVKCAIAPMRRPQTKLSFISY